MTDNTTSNSAPSPQDQPCFDRSPAPSPGAPGSSENWEVITFPGQMAIADTPASPSTEAPTPAPAPAPLHRTEDLIQLIQDLNQCNDALLIRVSDLEESLERSQAALQAEIERNQTQGLVAPDRAPAPPQVAQLLSELEATNDGLRRATIHNETLQTELESSQQRVAQLERECTLLQQRFSEKNTALHRAEDSCRDLKARLHRQQRYTLQFKTALEKCLNMANEAQHSPVVASPMAGFGTEEAQPVAMPKAQEIQPWTAPSLAEQPAALANLIHNLKTPASEESVAPVAMAPAPIAPTPEPPVVAPPPSRPVAPEATDPVQATPAITDPWLTPAPDPAPNPGFTEPSPWGAPLTAPPEPERTETAATAKPEPEAAPAPLPTPAPRTAWVAPTVAPTAPAAQAEPVAPRRPAPPEPATTPVVYPQRPQRKIASLAAVQLPSFGRPPRRS